jgi:hypothetical protein
VIKKIKEITMRSLAKTIAAASLLLAFVGVSSASAEILVTASRTGDYEVPGGGYQPVPLTKGSTTELTFKVEDKGPVVIIYNAECGVVGDTGSWLSIRILVDGQVVNPKTGGNYAFCAATGEDYIWTSVARQSFVNLKPGSHTITVEASLQGATTARLDDTSLVVFK